MSKISAIMWAQIGLENAYKTSKNSKGEKKRDVVVNPNTRSNSVNSNTI